VSAFDQYDTNHDGKIDMFELADRNHDGNISRQEFASVLR